MKLSVNRIESPFVFEVTNGTSTCLLDAAEGIGGKNKGLRPMEMVAAGLAGCIAIDVLLILKKQRMETQVFNISIEAERVNGIPSPFESIVLTFEVDPHIDREKLARDIQLVIDKYCSVSASLKETIEISFKIIEA